MWFGNGAPAGPQGAASYDPRHGPRVLGHQAHGRRPPRQPAGAPCAAGSTTSTADAFYCVVDLHALTVPQDPAELRRQSLELATLFVAVGLDPEVCTLFVQSHVHEHTELAWLMECTARSASCAG